MSKKQDFYRANLAALKEFQPEAARLLLKKTPEPTGEIVAAAEGSPNLCLTDDQGKVVHLHDRASPAREAEHLLRYIAEGHTGFIALLGMGLGYFPLAILKERPLLRMLAIFELDPGIFLQAMRHQDLRPLLQDPRLILVLGEPEDVATALAPAARTLQLENADILMSFPDLDRQRQSYADLKDKVYGHINTQNIGGATTKALGWDFMANRFAHATTFHHHRLLDQIKDEFSGKPAILVAGGPSLNKNIATLKQARDKAVILAVDTVLPTLLRHGIQPHFLSSIDPKNLTYEKFADVVPQAQDISLICSTWVNPRTPKTFPALQVYWAFTSKHVEAWLSRLLGGETLYGGAGTVAHLNFIAAHILGCDPIIFVGQDLAYPGTASHAEGTVLHGRAPTAGKGDGRQPALIKVPGVNGGEVYTDRSFLSMKQHFETAIREQGSPRTYINATEGGAHIEGTEVLPLQQTLDRYCSQTLAATDKLRELAATLPPPDASTMRAEFQKDFNRIKTIRLDIKKLNEKCRNAIAKLDKAGPAIHGFSQLPESLKKAIREIDALNKKLDGKDDGKQAETKKIWQNLEEITMAALQVSDRQRQYINTLANDPSKYALWLRENCKRFTTINQARVKVLDTYADNLERVLDFHQRERACLEKITTGKEQNESRLQLAKLYLETANYELARPHLEQLRREWPDNGEVFLNSGKLATLRAEHDQAADYFAQALALDQSLAAAITDFQTKLGDECLWSANYFKTLPGRRASSKYMVNKGLRYAPAHQGLRAELANLLRADLAEINRELEQGRPTEAANLCNEWLNSLEAATADHVVIEDNDLQGSLLLAAGKIAMAAGDHEQALNRCRQALQLMPNSADALVLTMEVCFALGDFDGGIEALNQAIAIDRNKATRWEVLGDELHGNGQYGDAALAYEQCLHHLPEKIEVLRKIAESQMAAGKLEEARNTLLLLQEKMLAAGQPAEKKQAD